MATDRRTYDPQTADPRVREIVDALVRSHQQHGTTADAQQESLARRQLRFITVAGKPLGATYIDSALAFARKAADLKNQGKPS